MTKAVHRCLCISDFNLQNFAGYLGNNPDYPAIETIAAPYGQVAQILFDPTMPCWHPAPDVAVVWTRPQSVIPHFQDVLDYRAVGVDTLLQEVDSYCELLRSLAPRVSFGFIPTWTLPHNDRGWGLLDMADGFGMANLLMQMNLRLSQNLAQFPNLYLLNAQRWMDGEGSASNPKLWYMAKVAYGNHVFKRAATDVKSALRGIAGLSRRLVVLDLDNTLWGGIVGDAGWENLALGGHDPVGEAFVDFQKELKALTNRGILLALASKNEEIVALEAIDNHPEMVLRRDDLAGWRINWHDKAQNIAEMVQELNLGLQSVVFIDDNPAERARVREALPDVLTPDWPDNPMQYAALLRSMDCFDTPRISQEDVARTRMVVAERQRTTLKTEIGSLEDWLQSLDIHIAVEELNERNLPRTAQLFNKTNQMSLSTRRMTEMELAHWVRQENHTLWTFRVSDKFGDYGLTGIISLVREGAQAGRIADFILSCRVMGRKVEETMVAIAVERAQKLGMSEIYARYIPTDKNKPCLNFWRDMSGFTDRSDTFHWCAKDSYPIPVQVTIE